jgi:hypothetical protein
MDIYGILWTIEMIYLFAKPKALERHWSDATSSCQMWRQRWRWLPLLTALEDMFRATNWARTLPVTRLGAGGFDQRSLALSLTIFLGTCTKFILLTFFLPKSC